MSPYLLVNVVCLLLCALPFVAIVLWFKQRQSKIHEAARAAVGDAEILLEEPTALWVAVDDKGNQTVQGNGVLLLTPEDLYFHKLLPKTEIRVPRQHILRIERPDLDVGRGRGRLLLCENGSEQRQAWMVEDHAAWVSALS